jgi:hypothetical protein
VPADRLPQSATPRVLYLPATAHPEVRVSAMYHRVTWTAATRRRMRRLDHAMIFLLIAGVAAHFLAISLYALPTAERPGRWLVQQGRLRTGGRQPTAVGESGPPPR